MSTVSNISQSSASRKIVNKQVFYNECNTNTPKSLNYNERRDLFRKHASKLLKWKGYSVGQVLEFFLRKANDVRHVSYHSVKTIANNIGISDSQVKRCTKLLHDLNLIKKIRRGEMKTNLYIINFDILRPPCEPPTTYEGSSYGIQSIRSFYNNSNCNNIEVKKMNDSIKRDEKPTDEIIIDTFYPSGTALAFLNKHIDLINIDTYIKELRTQLRLEEKTKGSPLIRSEANYKTFAIIKKTKELRDKYQERYIERLTRQTHKGKEIKPFKSVKIYQRSPEIPESCKPVENPITYEEMQEIKKQFNIIN